MLGVRRDRAPSRAHRRSARRNAELTNRVRRLYFEEYIKVWDKYLADVRMVRCGGLEQSVQVARALAAVDSPLAAFLRGVDARDDRWSPPLAPRRARARARDREIGRAAIQQKLDHRQARDVGGARQGRRCPARATAKGAPLEAMVDDHFDAIHRLVTGTPPPIDDSAEALQRRLRLPGRGRRGAEDEVGAAAGRRRRARSRPPPASSPSRSAAMLEQLAGAAATTGARGRARRD